MQKAEEQSCPIKEIGEFWGEHVKFDRKSGVNVCLFYSNYGVLEISPDDGDDDDWYCC